MFWPVAFLAWTGARRVRRIASDRCRERLCIPEDFAEKRVGFMPKVTFVTEKKDIEVPVGANLRQEAIKAGVQVYKGIHRALNCHGFGLCGSCKVLVKKGGENLSSKGLLERFTLATAPTTQFAVIGHESDMRLSCQVKVNGDCSIETRPAFNWSGDNFWQKPYPNK
jgi:ferredoxin